MSVLKVYDIMPLNHNLGIYAMPILASILAHIVYLALGRALIEKFRRDGTIFYADWLVASASAYFICWYILGLASFIIPYQIVHPFYHLTIGFILFVVLDIWLFRMPRSFNIVFKDLFALIIKTRHIIKDTHKEIRIVKYTIFLLVFSYSYFIYKGLSVPPYEYDVLSYHIPLAIDFFREKSLIPPPDRYWHFYFPANFELWLSTWLSAGRSPSVALAQLACVIPLAITSYILSRAMDSSRTTSVLTSLAILGAPIIMFQSITPLNELFSLPFLICTLIYSFEFIKYQKVADIIYMSLSLGLAVGTKYSFLILIPTLPIAILIALLFKHGIKKIIFYYWVSYLVIFIIPLTLPSGFWYLRNWVIKGNPFFPFEFSILGKTIFKGIPTIFDPNFDLNFVTTKFHWLIYPWIEGKYSAVQGLGELVGFIGATSLILFTIYNLIQPSTRPNSVFIISFIVISIIFWWNLTQHEPRFLIYILPILAFHASKALDFKEMPYRLCHLIFLIALAITIGQSITILKKDINKLAYDGRFMEFYGLPSEVDNFSPHGTTLLFSDESYGHLFVYPLSGKKFSRRVVVIGLEKVRNEAELKKILYDNLSIIPPDIDHILYYTCGESPKIDLQKVISLNLEGIYRFSQTRRAFISSAEHKVYSYIKREGDELKLSN